MDTERHCPCGGIIKKLAILIFACSAAFYVYFYSQSVEPSSFRSFTVSGDGKVVAVPDVAQFTFSVITQGGKNITALQKENIDKVNSILDFIKKSGVDAKDVQTQNYGVSPRYQYYDCNRVSGICPPAEIVGYSIDQSVLVKVRDFEKTGDLLSGVVTKGANNVSQLSFAIDDPTAVQNEARAKAIEKAQAKAKATAKAGDFHLGKLLGIEEGGYVPVPMYSKTSEAFGVGGGARDESSAMPAVEPGSQDVVVNVTLRYEIK